MTRPLAFWFLESWLRFAVLIRQVIMETTETVITPRVIKVTVSAVKVECFAIESLTCMPLVS